MEEVRTTSKTARRNRPATFFAESAHLADRPASLRPLSNSQKSEAEIMREQEEKLKAKFGRLAPKKKLIHKDVKYFDSADYSMHKQKHEEAKVEEDLHQPSKLNSSPAKPN